MLLILTGDFEEADEPLALLVAPSILAGLDALALHADELLCKPAQICSRTFRAEIPPDKHIICSPWTTNLVSQLERLHAKSTGHEEGYYLTCLCTQTGALSGRLLGHVRAKLCLPAMT